MDERNKKSVQNIITKIYWNVPFLMWSCGESLTVSGYILIDRYGFGEMNP
jgi:hypothetical protein